LKTKESRSSKLHSLLYFGCQRLTAGRSFNTLFGHIQETLAGIENRTHNLQIKRVDRYYRVNAISLLLPLK